MDRRPAAKAVTSPMAVGPSPSDLWCPSVRRNDSPLVAIRRATRIGRALGEALALQLSVKRNTFRRSARDTLSAALAAGGRMTREGVPAGRLVRDRSGGRARALA
jgi:hypothetical protein